MTKRFADLTEQEIVALAASLEEEDDRIYGNVAEGLRAQTYRRPPPSSPRKTPLAPAGTTRTSPSC